MESNVKNVRDYLNHLTDIKKSAKWPISLEIEDGLYNIFDGDGQPVVSLSEELYKMFQEL